MHCAICLAHLAACTLAAATDDSVSLLQAHATMLQDDPICGSQKIGDGQCFFEKIPNGIANGVDWPDGQDHVTSFGANRITANSPEDCAAKIAPHAGDGMVCPNANMFSFNRKYGICLCLLRFSRTDCDGYQFGNEWATYSFAGCDVPAPVPAPPAPEGACGDKIADGQCMYDPENIYPHMPWASAPGGLCPGGCDLEECAEIIAPFAGTWKCPNKNIFIYNPSLRKCFCEWRTDECQHYQPGTGYNTYNLAGGVGCTPTTTTTTPAAAGGSTHTLMDGCSTNSAKPPSAFYPSYGQERDELDTASAGMVVCCNTEGTLASRSTTGGFPTPAGTCISGEATNDPNDGRTTFADAKDKCTELGMRLCSTQAEVDLSCYGACQYDNALVWTAATTATTTMTTTTTTTKICGEKIADGQCHFNDIPDGVKDGLKFPGGYDHAPNSGSYSIRAPNPEECAAKLAPIAGSDLCPNANMFIWHTAGMCTCMLRRSRTDCDTYKTGHGWNTYSLAGCDVPAPVPAPPAPEGACGDLISEGQCRHQPENVYAHMPVGGGNLCSDGGCDVQECATRAAALAGTDLCPNTHIFIHHSAGSCLCQWKLGECDDYPITGYNTYNLAGCLAPTTTTTTDPSDPSWECTKRSDIGVCLDGLDDPELPEEITCEVEKTKECKPWCYSKKHKNKPWKTRKCEWYACAACPECDAPPTTTTTTDPSSTSWECTKRSDIGVCLDGLDDPELPEEITCEVEKTKECKPWCYSKKHTNKPWKARKCEWYACAACPECEAPPTTTATTTKGPFFTTTVAPTPVPTQAPTPAKPCRKSCHRGQYIKKRSCMEIKAHKCSGCCECTGECEAKRKPPRPKKCLDKCYRKTKGNREVRNKNDMKLHMCHKNKCGACPECTGEPQEVGECDDSCHSEKGAFNPSKQCGKPKCSGCSECASASLFFEAAEEEEAEEKLSRDLKVLVGRFVADALDDDADEGEDDDDEEGEDEDELDDLDDEDE